MEGSAKTPKALRGVAAPVPLPLFGYVFDPLDIPLLITLILLEGVLSFDNAAVLAAMTRRLGPERRRKALLYGLVGAYVFRILAILLVTFIIENPWLRFLGGGYLVFLAVRHLLEKEHPHTTGEERAPWRIPGLSTFWATVVAVEITDIAFALDQVLAAVAMTDKVQLIIAASLIAILLLRVSALYMTRLMDWFPALERLAYVAVLYVGAKLLLEVTSEFAADAGLIAHAIHVPKAISITVTLSLLVVPVIAKAIHDKVRKRRAGAA